MTTTTLELTEAELNEMRRLAHEEKFANDRAIQEQVRTRLRYESCDTNCENCRKQINTANFMLEGLEDRGAALTSLCAKLPYPEQS